MQSIYSELNKLSPPAMLTAGIITLATVTGLGIEEFSNFGRVAQTLNWSQCNGRVVSSTEHDLKYEYNANGKMYSSRKIYYDQSERRVAPTKHEYRAGQAIRVYYDPQDASNSVLKTVPARGEPNRQAYLLGALLGIAMISASLNRISELKGTKRTENHLRS